MNGLPDFIKGIGLGKKIYKKLIKDLGYISSFNGYEPSVESSMVWRSIAKDEEVFTFTDDENIISFWNELDYNIIIEKLKEFYNNNFNNYQLDDDFIRKYQLNNDFIEKL
jgi:DNA-binding MltR family transcriptional regulator